MFDAGVYVKPRGLTLEQRAVGIPETFCEVIMEANRTPTWSGDEPGAGGADPVRCTISGGPIAWPPPFNNLSAAVSPRLTDRRCAIFSRTR